ncbi:hypothetical protein Agabi119p4_10964 [Agaricus bisporus var. burnettii]|uniref:Phosphatidylinositol-specific phospholipase C X domain-containing protein n=1 Tax=Agaricus bisporus var. burnettii TaxID=192524 RepID=A0A8H7C142_AGABI|nr:hypothetical protein Agabi119p4_10964 [Agaricus bisporus var. burnettii]
MSTITESRQRFLEVSALEEVLDRGRPLLGIDDENSQTDLADWMSKFSDDNKLVHMNLPAAHDAATGSYTDARREELMKYTGPNVPPANTLRCQQRSFYDMLNDGIRAFDIRFAYNPGSDTVGFYHAKALLAPTTRFEDVFIGFYAWLEKHPTETILISLKHEGTSETPYDANLQKHIYDFFGTELAKRYWVQRNGTLGTLGEARGKLVLLQRNDYPLLQKTLPIGLDLGPERWPDNPKLLELVYNKESNQIAYIEDYYRVSLPPGSTPKDYIQVKFDAVIEHLENAIKPDLNPDQLYITFASACFIGASNPPITPRMYAVGDGAQLEGVNQRLLPWLKEHKGKRFGIILLDFYDVVPELVKAVIGL